MRRARPDSWKDEIEASEVQVLPLVDDAQRSWQPGWTSYADRFGEAPDVEVMCGGINTKSAGAAALWRQGNLLHFGFEQGPHELNATGRALLDNAIHYIARFSEDRPIARAPSVFVTGKSIPRRANLLARLRGDYELEWLVDSFGPEEQRRLGEMGRAAYCERFASIAGMCGLDDEWRLVLDEDLEAWQVANDDPALIRRCVEAIGEGDGRQVLRARRLLARYVPCGPGADAGPEAWARWLEEHEPYLFFSETGRFRWYVDPLAKSRAVPSKELRGTARGRA